MYIPKYFTLAELCKSDTANRRRIVNVPTFKQVENLNNLCRLVLDVAREKYGKPITVTSGYRCPALNSAVGGVYNSQHITGAAADIVCSDMGKLFDIFSELPAVDQLLFERSKRATWIHVSISECGKPRHKILKNYIV